MCILANFLKGWKSYSVLPVRTVSLLKPFIVRCEITHPSFPNRQRGGPELSVLLLRRQDCRSCSAAGVAVLAAFRCAGLRDKQGVVVLLNWALNTMESIVLLLKFLNS